MGFDSTIISFLEVRFTILQFSDSLDFIISLSFFSFYDLTRIVE